jgi:hypothetical protein
MNKFKIGDLVKIREDLSMDKSSDYPSGITNYMLEYKNCAAKIARVEARDSYVVYYLDIDNEYWTWNENMLELVKNEHDFTWAISQMNEHKKPITTISPDWPLNFLKLGNLMQYQKNMKTPILASPSSFNLMATDWEIYEDKLETLSDHVIVRIDDNRCVDSIVQTESIEDYLRIIKREIKKGNDPMETINKYAGNKFK